LKLPLGYRFAATYAGIRKNSSNEDLGLIVSDTPASAAAVFTRNRVQAAPIKIAKQHIRASRGRVSAILVNAGNPNCATAGGEDDDGDRPITELVEQPAKVSAEMHIYAYGPHGFGLRPTQKVAPVMQWTERMKEWLARIGATPDGHLRKLGLALMAVGLWLVYMGRF